MHHRLEPGKVVLEPRPADDEDSAAGVQEQLEAQAALARAASDRQAIEDERAALRAEQRMLVSSHAEEVAEARKAKEAELREVEARVVSLTQRKDATIAAMGAQLSSVQAELHTTREQLHATQQEILAMP